MNPLRLLAVFGPRLVAVLSVGIAASNALSWAQAQTSAGPAPKQAAAPAAAATAVIPAFFACDRDKGIRAVFVNGAQNKVRLNLSDGREFVLPQVPSASGARYANRDERLVFWNTGDTALIKENGVDTFTGCVMQR